jgi:signal transduction histidine kinase
MPDYYHLPALILTALLLPAFGFFYRRSRDARTLLWFTGFLFALVSMAANFFAGDRVPWVAPVGKTAMLLGTALFLGSLSPLRFRVGRFRIPFVIPYTVPLVCASVLFYGVFRESEIGGLRSMAFCLLLGISFGVGTIWDGRKGPVPRWLGVACSGLCGLGVVWACHLLGPGPALDYAVSVNLLMTVILLVFVFPRFSAGLILSVLGFWAWSLSFLRIVPWTVYPGIDLNLARGIAISQVVAALGMIVLALEEEIASNQAARECEGRVRLQLEAYLNLLLTRRRVEDFDRQASDVCEIVVKHSRFTQAALLLERGGRYRLAGSAGLDASLANTLDEVAHRIPAEGFLAPDSTPAAAGNTMTRRLDLTPWLPPGDSAESLQLSPVFAVPMWGRSRAEGALLLKGLCTGGRRPSGSADDSPSADDLLPIEMLVTRLQATRNQTKFFEKLIEAEKAEKYACVGQLAGNIAQQLSNPLTAILGYTTLLQESRALDANDHKAVAAIAAEARRIRTSIVSLSRMPREQADLPSSISVGELLEEIERLYKNEFQQRSIEFQMIVAPDLPRVLCGAQQFRQAVVHCLQYAMGAVERENPAAPQGRPKTIRLEATSQGGLVQVSVSHSGPGFLHQERAFDPFVPAQAGNETAGLGLSLCATILTDQNGRASAVNLEPQGAAIILELQAA